MCRHNVIFDQSEDKMATNLSLKPRNIISWLKDAEKIPEALCLWFLYLTHRISAKNLEGVGMLMVLKNRSYPPLPTALVSRIQS